MILSISSGAAQYRAERFSAAAALKRSARYWAERNWAARKRAARDRDQTNLSALILRISIS